MLFSDMFKTPFQGIVVFSHSPRKLSTRTFFTQPVRLGRYAFLDMRHVHGHRRYPPAELPPPARDRRRQRVRQRREAAGEAAGDDLHVLSQEYSALNIDWQSTEPAALDCYQSWSTGNLG